MYRCDKGQVDSTIRLFTKEEKKQQQLARLKKEKERDDENKNATPMLVFDWHSVLYQLCLQLGPEHAVNTTHTLKEYLDEYMQRCAADPVGSKDGQSTSKAPVAKSGLL